jgi:3-oxoadipate CoA-transferase, beta subunit
MMEMVTKTGESKLVKQCSYPLTGVGCVARVYTEMAVIDVGPHGAKLVELAPGVSFEELQGKTGVVVGR